jgi:DNA mismatch repair protein MutS2
VKNVSVEFHPTTMRPTYKLLYDLPGESHAILTAERIGLPERIIEGARAYLDKSAGGGSLLIQNLKEKLALVEKEVEEAATLRATLESERRALGEEREGMLRELRHEARELLNGAQRRIAEISKSLKKRATHNELKSSPTPQTPEIRPQELMEQLRREISEKFGGLDTPRGHMPEVGARVRLKKFGKDGTVTETLDRGRLAISLGGVNIIADLDDVELIAEGQRKKNAFQSAGFGVDKSPAAPSWEINVIGLRVDEALPIVEKAIDQALLSGLPSIGIIHGKGTGRLRKGIWEFLTGHPLVRRFQLGEARFGGEGVTMVEMATD